MTHSFIKELQPDSFPIVEHHFLFKSCAINLPLPHPEAIQNLFHPLKQNLAGVATPYWSRLWPASIALCHYLEDHLNLLQNGAVLELGAGLGLPSLFAGFHTSHVYCTDINPNAIVWAKHAAITNGLLNIQCILADWNLLPDNLKSANTLLLSDANYNPDDFVGLLQVIHSFLEAGQQVVLSTPQRLSAKSFVTPLLSYCQHQESFDIDWENIITGVSVFQLKK